MDEKISILKILVMYFKPLVSMVDFYLGENIDGTASRNVYWILSSNP